MKISFDFRQFEAQLRVLKQPHVPLMRALNKSIASGNTMAARLVSQDLGIQVGVVKDFLKVSKASASNLSATLSASAKRIPIIDFKARGPEPSRGRPGGVRASLKSGAGVYPRAFIATMSSGHRGVFERVKGATRLPIRELRGPSIWKAYGKVADEVEARVREQLVKNVASEINYALSQAR